ncbi:uncharacterized protein [Diadema antillarum]|uniref:uncharacterized protein n=1 Tax=Diadema antillarum TaxID=105358 RepID=UPI003A877AFB
MTKKPKNTAPVLLRRPIAQPPPAKPEPSAYKTTSYQLYQSQSVPSLLELSQEFSEHHQFLAPSLPSDAQSVTSDINEDVYAPQNTPRTKDMALQSASSQSFSSPEAPPDWKFIIESRYNMNNRANKAAGKALESDSLVKPYKPRGPDPFPLRQPKQPPEVKHEILYANVDDPRYYEIPAFSLNDFCYDLSRVYEMPREQVKNIVFSKQNFKKMTTLFASFTNTPRQEKVNTLELKGEDIPTVNPRVPQHQLLIEMACEIEQQMRQLVLEDVQSQMHSDQTGKALQSAGSMSVNGKSLPPLRRDKESLFSAPVSKYFQGSRRSGEPFDSPNPESQINPAELAILECLVNGGVALSLKAHFVSALPQMNPVLKTLTYLNLSFNDFKIIPSIVFEIENLLVLKLRNNPIREVPYEVGNLTRLRTLVLSFCILSDLPPSLFTLPIKFLDLSYNKLTFLPNEISHLKRLRELNLEGNQIAALPSGMLKLRELKYLRVINNFMHPLFWKENSQNNPQRLSDMAALVCKQEGLDALDGLQESIRVYLNSYTTCDCCGGPLYGPGLRLIRPCRKIYGVRQVPFFFIACSPSCRDYFLENTRSLTDLIYEDDEFDSDELED